MGKMVRLKKDMNDMSIMAKFRFLNHLGNF